MKYNLFLLLLFFSLTLCADNIGMQQAERVAKEFFKSGVSTRSSDIQLECVWDGEDVHTRADSPPAFYVFNCTSGGGFVIIAGEDAVSPVLGYSLTGRFEVKNMPSNLRGWMNTYRDEINWVRTENITSSVEIKQDWMNVKKVVSSIDVAEGVLHATALWDQGTPYNKLCPKIDNALAPAGCVATALAITMKYNQWPDKGSGGTYTYTTKTHERVLSATYNVAYSWDDMPDVYTEGLYTVGQANAVGRLMYHCGVFSDMDYATAGSGALTSTAVMGMVKYMKYDKGMTVLRRDWYTTGEWNNLLRAELNSGRLVVYGGSNKKSEGHQFVFDGYKADKYHVNWGWGGMANGYYLLSTLEPNQQGAGGNSGGGFSVGQDAVVGIKKIEVGSVYHDVLAFFKSGSYIGLKTTETAFQPYTNFEVEAGAIGNYSIRNFTGVVALLLVNAEGDAKEFISPELTISDLKIGFGSAGKCPCVITQAPMAGDRIWMMYKSGDNDIWERVRGGSDVISEIVVREDLTGIAKTPTESVPLTIIMADNERVIVKSPVVIKELSLYDIEGRLLEKMQVSDAAEYEFSCIGYSAGIYILHATTAEGVSRCKFVKK